MRGGGAGQRRRRLYGARARRKLWRCMARAPADGDLGLMGAREEARRRRGLAGRIHRGEVIACGRNRWNR